MGAAAGSAPDSPACPPTPRFTSPFSIATTCTGYESLTLATAGRLAPPEVVSRASLPGRAAHIAYTMLGGTPSGQIDHSRVEAGPDAILPAAERRTERATGKG